MSCIRVVYLLIHCEPVQPEVSLRLSPDRSVFFPSETINLSCEEEQNPVEGWTVRRISSMANGTCGPDWGRGSTEVMESGISCTITMYDGDNGEYWCQSESTSEVSRSIHIELSDGDVLLESPVRPVPEGDNVTFRCLHKDQAGKPSSERPADFYQNGSLFSSESTGQMAIHHVNKSHEGFYKCSISGLGESPENWMKVTTNASSTSNPSTEGPPLLTRTQVIVKILVTIPWVVATILYISILRDRARARAAAANARMRVNDVIMEVAE